MDIKGREDEWDWGCVMENSQRINKTLKKKRTQFEMSKISEEILVKEETVAWKNAG